MIYLGDIGEPKKEEIEYVPLYNPVPSKEVKPMESPVYVPDEVEVEVEQPA